MDKQDEALTISNPRLLSAIYFTLLALIANLTINLIMYLLDIDMPIPLFKLVILSVIVAGFFGALFGERIVHSRIPYKRHVFWWGFLMVIIAVPFYNLGFFALLKESNSIMFEHASTTRIIWLYLMSLFYSFTLIGIWLAILAGVAAIYLRGHLVYFFLSSLNVRRRSPTGIVVGTKTPGHGEQTIHTDDQSKMNLDSKP